MKQSVLFRGSESEKVPLTLTVQRADFSRAIFTVQAEVRDAAGSAGAHHH